MLKLKVTYFLSEEGSAYFPSWFHEVFAITSQQDGFHSMYVEYNNNIPTIYLNFKNRELLEQWKKHPRHDELVSKITVHFIKPHQVEII
jgi:hypothetical protein